MNSLSLVPPTENAPQFDRLSWGAVSFQVTDLERAVEFWTTTLGLIDRNQSEPGVALGTPTTTLIILHSGASRPVAPAFTGMYHVAIGVRTQAEFSRLLARLIYLNVPVSPTDHLLAKSLYFSDPDGLEIEITLETPERFGRFGDMSKGLTLYDAEGHPHSGRAPLDVDAELTHVMDAELMAPLSADGFLAHLHFKVAALEPALDWFEGLGFARHLTLGGWGFADMGAGIDNTHRLAMNTWAGPGHAPAPDDMARLLHYELIAHDPKVMTQATTALTSKDGVLHGQDPAGVSVTLMPAKTS